MEFHELLEKRHSIRAYLEKPIEKEKIEKIISTACSAPSAGNLQAYKIAIVIDEKIKKALYYVALEQKYILQAPVVLVFFADQNQSARKYGEKGANLFSLQDATIAAAYIQLEAVNLGLGSVWIGAFDAVKVGEILNAKDGEIPVAIIPIGYAGETGRAKMRKKKEEIVREI